MTNPAWRLPSTDQWLPQFCQIPTLFATMLLAQLVVLIAVLTPSGGDMPMWQSLFVATAFAQWIALSNAAALCLLRPLLLRTTPALALALVLALVSASVYAMAWIGYTVDRGLELGLTPAWLELPRFLGGTVAMAVLILVAGLRYGYVHEQWRRQVQAQARAEVAALTARIRPHFLFNSMNTIASLVRDDPDTAETVVLDLAELFRSALAAGEQSQTLERELELCQRYLAIEQLRLGPRLRVLWDVDQAPLDLLVPPLLLQPLVENAVYHGIQPLPQGGEVHVRAECSPLQLKLRVDNPCPPSPPARGAGHGMALDNVRQRLKLAFGPAARLEVESAAGYYAVTLHLPLKRESHP